MRSPQMPGQRAQSQESGNIPAAGKKPRDNETRRRTKRMATGVVRESAARAGRRCLRWACSSLLFDAHDSEPRAARALSSALAATCAERETAGPWQGQTFRGFTCGAPSTWERRSWSILDGRGAHKQHVRFHRGESLLGGDFNADTIQVIFVDRDGDEEVIDAPVGKSLLEIAHMNDIELEGACEGSLACSTCHVIIEDEEQFDILEELSEPTDDENDMLDLAFGLTETSRLGCQIICSPELDGLRVRIPNATRNMAVDGFVPKPH